jgi:hypothetical protein
MVPTRIRANPTDANVPSPSRAVPVSSGCTVVAGAGSLRDRPIQPGRVSEDVVQ